MGPPVRREDPIDPAAEELYGVALSQFTAERKRLAGELRAEGDRSLAARVGALARPTVAAWVVNQLWREAREDMEELFAAGQRMRSGEPGAWQAQRAVLARLGVTAGDILRRDKHAASPATLRRVTSTLQALSAQGSFGPDAAGRLVADRDPPGFEVLGDEETAPAAIAAAAVEPRGERVGPTRARERIADKAAAHEDKQRSRAEANAAVEQARAAGRDKAERERVADKARSRAAALGKTIERLRSEVEDMEEKLSARREALRAAEADRDAALREAERASPARKKSRP